MRPVFAGAFAVLLLVLTGCGMVVQPRVGDTAPGVDGSPPHPTDPTRPTASPNTRPQVHTLNEQVCRSSPIPRGWIVVRYVADEQTCPRPVNSDDPYTLAVVHRYEELPVWSELIVCADQVTPSGWRREPDEVTRDACPGARVKTGEPTAYLMRRIY